MVMPARTGTRSISLTDQQHEQQSE